MKKNIVIHNYLLVGAEHENNTNKTVLILKQTAVSPANSLFTKTYRIEIDQCDHEYELTFREDDNWTKWSWPGYLENGQLVLLTKIVPVDMSQYEVIGKYNLVKEPKAQPHSAPAFVY